MSDATFDRLLAEIKADAIRAVTPPARCEGCGYHVPAESLTVVSLRGHRLQWCPGCNTARQPHPDEITLKEPV